MTAALDRISGLEEIPHTSKNFISSEILAMATCVFLSN